MILPELPLLDLLAAPPGRPTDEAVPSLKYSAGTPTLANENWSER